MTPNNEVLEARVVALEKRMANSESDTKGLLAYKYSHEAQIQAWWTEQHKWNAQTACEIKAIRSSIMSLQKRWILLCGFAAALGGGVSNILARLVP